MPYKQKEDLFAAQKRHRIKIRKELFEFLADHPCIDCGENNPIVLDFDHREPLTKFKNIARMLSGHYSWKAISKEIENVKLGVLIATGKNRIFNSDIGARPYQQR